MAYNIFLMSYFQCVVLRTRLNLEWPLVKELAGLSLGQSKWTFCCREAFLGSELVLHPLVIRAQVCPCMSHHAQYQTRCSQYRGVIHLYGEAV